MTILDQINEIIEDYEYADDLDTLFNLQDKLSILSYNLVNLVCLSKKDYVFGLMRRKIGVIRSIHESKESSSAAKKSKAEYDNLELFEKEAEHEVSAYMYDLKLKQVNKILSAMAQKISYLKSLKENNNRLS
jgi:hypothetical protein